MRCSLLFLLSLCACLFSLEPMTSRNELNGSVDSKNFDVFASFIFWTAKEAGADCWAEVITTHGSASSNILKSIPFNWDPGFKVGIGYKQPEWDIQTYYTWFYTLGKDSVSSLPGSVLSTFLGNFYIDNEQGSGINGPPYQKASIDWSIRFHMFDCELARLFLISESLTLRPFFGAKGGWIHQAIHTKWYNPDLSAIQFLGSPDYSVGTEKLNNNFWGIGPQFGVHTKWLLLTKQKQSFYLLSDLSGAIMWGHWSFGDIFENSIQQKTVIDFAPLNYGASMIRSFLGCGWETCFSNQSSLSLKLGYETQFWLNQLQFYSFVAGRFANALTLQGGTFALLFDY